MNHGISIATKYKRKRTRALLSAGTCALSRGAASTTCEPVFADSRGGAGAGVQRKRERAGMEGKQDGQAKSKGRGVNAGFLRTLFL